MAVQRSSRSQPSSSPVRSTRLDRFGFGPRGDCCMLVRCKGASTALLLWHLRCSAICSSLLRSACRRPQSPSRSPNAHVRCSAAVSKRHTHSRMPTGLRRAIKSEAAAHKPSSGLAAAGVSGASGALQTNCSTSFSHTSTPLVSGDEEQGGASGCWRQEQLCRLARLGRELSKRDPSFGYTIMREFVQENSSRRRRPPFSGLALETDPAPASSSARRG
jgi:hypothetical protein